MTVNDTLYVYNLSKQLVGKITQQPDGYIFQYSKSYLTNNNSISLNPVSLPLNESHQSKTFFSKKLDGCLSVFTDSMPGIWGKIALESIKGKRLTDFELLLENQQDRLGNLVFNTELVFPDIAKSRIKEPFKWEDIIKAKEQFERTNQFDLQYQELFKQGASQGGARPKLTILKNHELYLAKLPTIKDYENKAQIEHGTLCLAKHLGINVAESSFIQLTNNSDIFLTKRFDFVKGNKLPYLSMQSILNVTHSHEASYGNFSLALRRLNGGINSKELYKRMVFNALISNHDDHYQNHAVYFKSGIWQLTPAFDILIGEGNRRSQAISIGENGGTKSIENLLSEVDKFNLNQSEAKDIITKMANSIQEKWQDIFLKEGINTDVINAIKWAVLNDFKALKHQDK